MENVDTQYIHSSIYWKVDVNEAGLSKIQDDNGDIAREDFIKFAQDNKLLDFGNVMGDGGMRLSVMAATGLSKVGDLLKSTHAYGFSYPVKN